jgi:hypothetical protein
LDLHARARLDLISFSCFCYFLFLFFFSFLLFSFLKACEAMEHSLMEVQKSYTVHLRVGLVDCANSKQVCKENAVEATPQVILYYKDRSFVYNQDEFSAPLMADFVSEGFKHAPAGKRKHLGFMRRLDWENVQKLNVAAIEDFFHSNRYFLVFCVLFMVWIWGIFAGSSLAHSPLAIRDMLKRDAEAMRRSQQAKTDKKKN